MNKFYHRFSLSNHFIHSLFFLLIHDRYPQLHNHAWGGKRGRHLICTANGNPEDYVYGWEFKSENESDTEKDPLQAVMRQDKRSYLTLGIVPQKRIYVCHANNTVGQGLKCEITVEGKQKRNIEIWTWTLN